MLLYQCVNCTVDVVNVMQLARIPYLQGVLCIVSVLRVMYTQRSGIHVFTATPHKTTYVVRSKNFLYLNFAREWL
jgi:hypothetical protein